MGKSEFECDTSVIHSEVIEKLKKSFLPDEVIFLTADFFKIFGDSTRFKILYALDKEEMCVGDISALLGMTISAVSHQLKILRDSNLVKTRRNGKIVYYSPADEHVQKVIECGVEHIMEKFEEK